MVTQQTQLRWRSKPTANMMGLPLEFKDGQTCGLSEEEKISIRRSKGQFVEGDTFKLAY